jgi:protein gp37
VKLLAVPGPNFVSMEPLLCKVNLLEVATRGGTTFNALSDVPGVGFRSRRIDWVIAGGESGHRARPSHAEWVRSLRDQCRATDTHFLFKQWGTHQPALDFTNDAKTIAVDMIGRVAKGLAPGADPARVSVADGWSVMRRVGKGAAGRELDGVIHDERPGPEAMPLVA